MSTRLSKSRFQKGLQCEKALWLAVHEPDSADPIDEATQWTFDQGTAVGRVAQGLFPGGVEVTEDYRHSEEALATTADLISHGARVLYEPAFVYDDVLVRVDILVATEDGRFDLYEVKSTTKLKDQHVTDAAVQTYVVEGAGFPVRRSNVVHLDTTYVYEGGEYDPVRLFAIEDVTEQVRAFLPLVPDTLELLRRVLSGPEPEVLIGQRCRQPYDCEFATRCHAFLPDEHPVTEIPRITDEALHAFIDAGILCIHDLPDNEFGLLTPPQRTVVRVVKAGEPEVDVDGLARDLDKLEYPIYHLDFETFRAALPLWPGSRPYELVPFQYSIHVEHRNGTFEHREYLHRSGGDPRRMLAEHLLADLGNSGSITHYTGYERQVLDALASALPDLAPSIAALAPRLFDLEAVIRSRTRHPATNGRTSIKCVLPAWCDDVSYTDLGIQDGQTASVRYLRAITGELDDAACERVFDDLAAYCGTDTLAMVRLLETLRGLTSNLA